MTYRLISVMLSCWLSFYI